MGSFDVPLDDERTQLDAFVEEYRSAFEVTLDGLTEDQARRRLVPSATTVLGRNGDDDSEGERGSRVVHGGEGGVK